MRSKNGGTSTTEHKHTAKRRGGFAAWLDERRVKSTVRRWHKSQKQAARRSRISQALQQVPNAGLIGDALYMMGFWTEYAAISAGRTAVRTAAAVLGYAGALVLMILRPLGVGLVTFLDDLLQPFVRLASGIRHIRALPEQYPEESSRQLRAEKLQYFKRGARRYLPLVWNIVCYALPVASLVGLVWIVRAQLNTTYRLEVRVNGETVGYVASEQVFDNARDDVQSRIASARAVMEASGVATDDAQWDISPTYTLAVSDELMTESEAADAILRASSDEIGDGTAVYIDGELRFVTTEGDHLRAFLDAVKSPYEDAFDPDIRVTFVHDIELVDGVYFLSSIVPYDTVIGTLTAQTEGAAYTVAEAQTAGDAAAAAGISFSSLQRMNPELTSSEQLVEAGTVLTTEAPEAELLKVEVIRRLSVPEDVQYNTIEIESDEYDLGEEIVIQEGQLGLQEVTQDVTYINGEVTAVSIVDITTVIEPVPEQVIVGTHVESNMVAQTGDATFLWPVPDYSGVSRWIENGRPAADITAAFGSSILAAAGGTVVTAENNATYGNYIVIDHGNGWQTLYAHMSGFAVAAGQQVSQGELIGYVGRTGVATGNHCHFEMYYNGTPVSARDYFPDIDT
ncbi:MAG TPA: peptidoglycan DD-metalloendopeptidase family protein [Candidatus Gemmiger faecigallinarum]|nr:peptidoglycan DD-metalloendopeptidase family protein [Candidatus Gemmiger faecigallinarum]